MKLTNTPRILRISSACIMMSLCLVAMGQSANDIIENGEVIKKHEKLFLKYDGEKFLYDVGDTPRDFLTLVDSALFLPKRSGVNVYLRPLNPLRFSYGKDIKFVSDPISESTQAAFDALIVQLGQNASLSHELIGEKNKEHFMEELFMGEFVTAVAGCTEAEDVKTQLELQVKKLDKTHKDELNKIFTGLKSMDFVDEETTATQIEKYEGQFVEIANYFKAIEDSLVRQEAAINEDLSVAKMASCNLSPIEVFSLQTSFYYLIDKAKAKLKEGKARVNNTKNALELVKQAYNDARKSKDGITWLMHVAEVSVKKDNISQFTFTVKESGFKLSDDQEIVKVEEQVKKSILVKFRDFQLFVPEVSGGVAYSFYEFNKFSTDENTEGETVVGAPTQESFKQMTFDAMINYLLYLPKSPLLPMIQLGAGANSSYPTFFSGVGIKGKQGAKWLSVSGGLAYTWTPQLNELEVGEVVSGQSAIDEDIKHEFQWPPKPYISLQLKF